MGNPEEQKGTTLGDFLREKLGERSPRWLAENTGTSRPAVDSWLSGEFTPRPQRLGAVASQLDCSPEELEQMVLAAGYNPKQVIKATNAYEKDKGRVRDPKKVLADKLIELLQTDDQFREMIDQKDPDIIELVSRKSR